MTGPLEAGRGYTDTEFDPNKVAHLRPNDNAPTGRTKFEDDLDRYFSKVIFDDSERPLVAPKWLVRDTVEDNALSFIGGQSAAGKSFVVMELARCLMTGEPFFGREIDRPCGFVLFAPEGQQTIDARMAAMKRHHRLTEDLPFAYLGELPTLETPEGRALIVALLQRVDTVFREQFNMPLGAVAMDTLAATFQIKDQNDSSEAAQRINQLQEIKRGVGFPITLLPVHHYGKTAESGLTGGHGWKAGADQVLSVLVERDEITGDCTGRELAVAKNRNGPEGPLAPFELNYLGLGYREDGTEWGSVFLQPRLDLPTNISGKASKAPRVSKNDRTFDDAFLEAMISHKVPVRIANGTGPSVQAVPLVPTVRDLFFVKYATGTDDPDRTPEENEKARFDAKRKAFQRVVPKLSSRYSTETINGVEYVWEVRR